jgi:hypothetical protein
MIIQENEIFKIISKLYEKPYSKYRKSRKISQGFKLILGIYNSLPVLMEEHPFSNFHRNFLNYKQLKPP